MSEQCNAVVEFFGGPQDGEVLAVAAHESVPPPELRSMGLRPGVASLEKGDRPTLSVVIVYVYRREGYRTDRGWVYRYVGQE